MSSETPGIHPQWMLASGNFFFRFRNSLFPCLFLVPAPVTRPAQFMGNPEYDRIVMCVGAALALTGQAFRLFVIGFAYIKQELHRSQWEVLWEYGAPAPLVCEGGQVKQELCRSQCVGWISGLLVRKNRVLFLTENRGDTYANHCRQNPKEDR